MHPIIENVLIMIMTIVVLVGGAYLLLMLLDWWLKLKSGNREQDGLTSMWASTIKQPPDQQDNLTADTQKPDRASDGDSS